MNDMSPNALARLVADLSDIPTVTDPKIVRRRSRDFFWYSPILNQQLNGKSADVIIAPRNEAEVVRVAAACARHRVPVTVRAGGTGNYGQAVRWRVASCSTSPRLRRSSGSGPA
jgi:FAD/FMN-containing dehydrogenase